MVGKKRKSSERVYIGVDANESIAFERMQLEDYHENAKDTDLVRMPRCENEDFVNLMGVLRTKMLVEVSEKRIFSLEIIEECIIKAIKDARNNELEKIESEKIILEEKLRVLRPSDDVNSMRMQNPILTSMRMQTPTKIKMGGGRSKSCRNSPVSRYKSVNNAPAPKRTITRGPPKHFSKNETLISVSRGSTTPPSVSVETTSPTIDTTPPTPPAPTRSAPAHDQEYNIQSTGSTTPTSVRGATSPASATIFIQPQAQDKLKSEMMKNFIQKRDSPQPMKFKKRPTPPSKASAKQNVSVSVEKKFLKSFFIKRVSPQPIKIREDPPSPNQPTCTSAVDGGTKTPQKKNE